MKVVTIKPKVMNADLVATLTVMLEQATAGDLQGAFIAALYANGNAEHYHSGTVEECEVDERILLAEVQLGLTDLSLMHLRNKAHTFTALLQVEE